MDPYSKMSIDDLYKKGIRPKAMTGIYIGCILIKEGEVTDNLTFKKYDWSKWETPTYHERLKPSYYILQKTFKSIGGSN